MKNRKSMKDFDSLDLPKNRKEVFFDCLKMRYGIVFGVGLMCVFFALPLIICCMVRDLNLSSLLAEGELYGLSQEQIYENYYSIKVTYAMMLIPCFVILGIGISGVMFIIRQLIWYEGLFFFSDFFEGIRKNWREYGASFLVVGSYNLGLTVINHPRISELLQGSAIGIGAIIVFPLIIFVLLQSLVYKLNFIGSIRNSVYMYMQNIAATLLVELCVLLPFVAVFIPQVIVKYLVLSVLILFLLPPALMGCVLYGCSVFDKFINQNQYPELVNKGIYKGEMCK